MAARPTFKERGLTIDPNVTPEAYVALTVRSLELNPGWQVETMEKGDGTVLVAGWADKQHRFHCGIEARVMPDPDRSAPSQWWRGHDADLDVSCRAWFGDPGFKSAALWDDLTLSTGFDGPTDLAMDLSTAMDGLDHMLWEKERAREAAAVPTRQAKPGCKKLPESCLGLPAVDPFAPEFALEVADRHSHEVAARLGRDEAHSDDPAESGRRVGCALSAAEAATAWLVRLTDRKGRSRFYGPLWGDAGRDRLAADASRQLGPRIAWKGREMAVCLASVPPNTGQVLRHALEPCPDVAF